MLEAMVILPSLIRPLTLKKMSEENNPKEINPSTEETSNETTSKKEVIIPTEATEEVALTETEAAIAATTSSTPAPDTPLITEDILDEEEEEEENEEDEDTVDENQASVKTTEIKEVDYSDYSMEKLVAAFASLAKDHPAHKIKNQVNAIRSEFLDKFDEAKATAKEAFIAEGGNEIDFFYESNVRKEFNTLYSAYRKSQKERFESIKKEQEANLKTREALVEELKALFNNGQSVRDNYNAFRSIQDRWNNVGNIPRDTYNIVWNNYKHHRDNFYSLLDLDRETRELDQKYNLDKKMNLVLKAQALGAEENINKAFRQLQLLHKVWKEDTGPVAKEYSDPVWEEFTAASQVIRDKKDAQLQEEEKKYEANLETKLALIASIETLTEKGATTHKQWQQLIKEVTQLRESFFKSGRVPKAADKKTWNAFKEATRNFNRAKNDFYKEQKGEQFDNLEKKKALIKIAQENKDNEDIQGTMNLMKKIQSDWKKIGHVPRKESDTIWKEFKEACNHFFNRIQEKRDEASQEEEENLQKKQTVLDAVEKVKLSGNHKTDIATIKEKINDWKTIGRVPFKKKNIENAFNKAIDGLFGQLDMDKKEAALIKFENKVNSMVAQEDMRQLQNEEFFISKKVGEVKAEILQLENNLQFFKHVEKTNPLVKEVYTQIDNHKEDLAIWISKLQKMRTIRKAAEAPAEAEGKHTDPSIENQQDEV